jgi:hypothetical protein
MSDAPNTPDRTPHEVACPECGESFSPRGIATHRRMRHGTAPAAVEELGTTLTRIAEVLERLESRLEPAAATKERPAAPPVPLGERATDLGVLERGLHDVLNEIARVKTETERQIAACRARAQSEEQKALEQTSFQMLGNLRRRQASLLFRLQEARGEDAIDNSLCI